MPYWTLPGGRTEPNEPLMDALAREVVEETGIRIEHPGMLCVKQVLTPETLFGQDEPIASYLAGRKIEPIWTTRHVPSVWS